MYACRFTTGIIRQLAYYIIDELLGRRIYNLSLGGGGGGGGGGGADRCFGSPGGLVTWHRAVECLVSVSNCTISYIFTLLWIYKYDDVVVSGCDKQHFYVLNVLSVANIVRSWRIIL